MITARFLEKRIGGIPPEVKLLGGLLLAWSGGFVWFLFDTFQAGRLLPSGVLTVCLECTLEAWAIISFFKSNQPRSMENFCFALFFCLLLPADIAFQVLHYVFKIDKENWTTLLLTTVPYTLAYLCGSAAFYIHIKERLSRIRLLSVVWLPLLLLIPAVFGILIPLVAGNYQQHGWNITLIEITLNSMVAVPFFFWATVTMIMSLDTMFPLLGLAGVISQLGNWGGISTYLLSRDTFTFGEYEFLWLCGIVTFWYGFVIVGRQLGPWGAAYLSPQSSVLEAHTDQRKSLVVQQRMTVIGVISASLIIAVLLLPRDVWSYRIVLFGIALGSYIALVIGELLSKQIIHYATQFGRVAIVDPVKADQQEIPIELWQLYQMAFKDEAVQRRTDISVRQHLSELASQVAHDIRSPLLALDSILCETSQMREDKRLIVRGAVGRIRDIANTLLEKHRAYALSKDASDTDSQIVASTCLLSSLIEPLVAEMHVKFQSRINIEIEAPIDEASYGLFACVEPIEFKRAISNLIDNAVEAIPAGQDGKVIVSVFLNGNSVVIQVHDNGCGISPHMLSRLGAKGESHGKTQGSGLGLFHARSCANTWGGCLDISSELGVGTTVDMMLPQALPPDWFVPGLVLDPAEVVVILDDDRTIHQVWTRRLAALQPNGRSIEAHHFSTPGELRGWVATNAVRAKTALYLLDQELLGFRETGLSLTSELRLNKQTILVTNRYDECAILNACQKQGIRMVPKALACVVPIRLSSDERQRGDAILIDDDAIVRQIWALAASTVGKRLVVYESLAQFFREADLIDRLTPIYIDDRLGNDVKGHEVSVRIHKLGFVNIILTTGYQFLSLPPLHIRAIVGKEPPWSTKKMDTA